MLVAPPTWVSVIAFGQAKPFETPDKLIHPVRSEERFVVEHEGRHPGMADKRVVSAVQGMILPVPQHPVVSFSLPVR
jgi:hypothetical protein